MLNRLKLFNFAALVTGIVTLCLLAYNALFYIKLITRINAALPLEPLQETANFVFIGFFFSLLFHIISIAALLLQFRYDKKITIRNLVTVFAGIASFICITGDWAALSDIGKQYPAGLDCTMEWTFLCLSLAVHVVYMGLFIPITLLFLRELRAGAQPANVVKDEVIFNLAHFIGLICGLAGFVFTLLLVFMNIPAHILKYLIPFYCPFIIFPYCFILFYWLIMQRGIKGTDWFDEKQWLDLGRASLLTLRLSIPGMAILCLVNYFSPGAGHVLVMFPFYLFMILLLFSGCTLYYNYKS
ncbi:MAG TPA: hypothetical protein PLP19_01715 [bacterium]|nr:hypothetical protein [bacterium]HPN42183.1 hypothetical protein [bacterium]